MEHIQENPWRGLLSYREGEILYGRDDDIRDLLQCVLRDRYTLLYGKSGIGKSSILNAAIIPALRRHGYTPVVLRLSHKGIGYIEQLHKALVETLGENGVREILPLKGEKESLYEYMHRHTFWNDDNSRAKLFLLFDQFEEIFTLQTDETIKKEFFHQLSEQCNDILPDYLLPEPIGESNNEATLPSDHPADPSSGDSLDDMEFSLPDLDSMEYVEDNDVRMIFTIREDFLSEFDYYAASIPQLRHNRYYLRPINEEQAAQIIMQPCPGLVSDVDAWLIISKVTNSTDFKLDGNPELTVDAAVLSLYLSRLFDARHDDEPITASLIEQKGGEIISDFYRDAIDSVSPTSADYLEDILLTGQGRRDNITLYDAIHDGHLTMEELNTLIEEKKILRRFNYAGVMRIEYVHDILCPVVMAHREERQLVLQQEKERKKLLEIREEDRKKNRKRFIAALSVAAAIALFVVGYLVLYIFPFREYYAGFTTRDGFPVGVGQRLARIDRTALPVHYRLTRRGLLRSHPFTEVEILNHKGESCSNVFVELPAVSLPETDYGDARAREFASKQRHISRWKYERDEKGTILRQVAYNIAGTPLFSIQFSRISNAETDTTKMFWMNFVDAEGKAMKVRNNGLDRMRAVMTNGYLTSVLFFSESGTPQKNGRQAYGYKYSMDYDNRVCTAIHPMDEYGDTVAGKALEFLQFDKYKRWTVAKYGTAEYDINRVVYTIENNRDTILLDDQGRMKYRSEVVGGTRMQSYSYDDEGLLLTKKEYSLASDSPSLVKSQTNTYYKNGKLHERTEFDVTDSIAYRRTTYAIKGDTTTTLYTGGPQLNAISLINNADGLCRIVAVKNNQDSINVTTKYYYKLDTRSNTEQLVGNDQLTYDRNGSLIKDIRYKNGVRVRSVEYDVENGIIVGRHVVGITGSIIRCPEWDEQGLCYYRLKYVRNYDGVIVSHKAVNEFGDESIVTSRNQSIALNIIPGEIIEEKDTVKRYLKKGIGFLAVSGEIVSESMKKQYIHITDTCGTWYRCGLRDGDLLLKESRGTVCVARPLLNWTGDKRYEKLYFNVGNGETGAENYPVYFTEEELKIFNISINGR